MRKNMMFGLFALLLLIEILFPQQNTGLKAIQDRGVLRHLGVPYAKFNTGYGDGFSVDLMKKFANYLNVKYEYVPSTFADVIPDLTGHPMVPGTNELDHKINIPVKGDVIATGFTVLEWRAKLVAFAEPIFPTQIWVVTSESSKLKPITPSETIEEDISKVKKLLEGHGVMGKNGTCLEPSLYQLDQTGADLYNFEGSVNDLVPAVLEGEAEIVLLDVPDALVGLNKWPSKVKILGPLSELQAMADAFRYEDKELLDEYNRFLLKIKNNGEYLALVKKYYPSALVYFPEFFGIK